MDDKTFARRALEEADVQLIPASLMPGGEGFCRISYATNIPNIIEGCKRLREWLERVC
jgi:aspartate/methionine/tyrosine aminotransferase